MANLSILKKDLLDFYKLPQAQKNKVYLFLAILFILSIVIGRAFSGFRFSPSNQPTITPTAVVTDTEKITQTVLSLSPAEKTLKVGQTETVKVLLSRRPVTAVDVVLTYDPMVLELSNIQNGDVFERVIQRKSKSGKLIFSAAVSPENAVNIKEGAVFSFAVKPKKETKLTTISFDAADTVTALQGENTLGVTESGKYKVTK